MAQLEGVLILVVSLIGLAEGVRLTVFKEPYILYDVIGPGYYIVIISGLLFIPGIIRLLDFGKTNEHTEPGENKGMKMRVVLLFGALVLYIFLMTIFGYFPATLFFLLISFRILGVKSLITNLVGSTAVAGAYYVIFIKYCHMVLPRGMFY
ncbi:tripartite tricarboxylate transporter TctB family protein [Thermodesulfobacteriota bacterium]